MTLKHRIEWNGDNNILVLDKGDHGHIEMTLDEFIAFFNKLKADLQIDERKPLDADDPYLTDDN